MNWKCRCGNCESRISMGKGSDRERECNTYLWTEIKSYDHIMSASHHFFSVFSLSKLLNKLITGECMACIILICYFLYFHSMYRSRLLLGAATFVPEWWSCSTALQSRCRLPSGIWMYRVGRMLLAVIGTSLSTAPERHLPMFADQ